VHLAKFGLGFSQGFSVGNEALVDITDCLEYLGQCPRTKVIALYIEGIRRGKEFLKVAREVSKKKPIVAYYVGGSVAGGRAGFSHTGALAGPDLLYDGVFRQCGIIRAATIEELFDYCYVLGSQPLPAGDRIALLTHSGGPGAAAADAAERSGLQLSEFSPATVEALRQVVPHTASISNPVDITFNRDPNVYSDTLPQALLKDPGVDLLFIYLLLPIHRVVKSFQALTNDPDKAKALADQFIHIQTDSVARLTVMSGKPVVGASFCWRTEPLVQELQDKGVPVLSSPERAVKALAALARYALWRQAVGANK
jgi:acyl-CoA synthetase (NDP forming)